MKFVFKTKKLRRRAEAAAFGAAEAARAGAERAGQSAENAVTRVKLSRAIRDLQEEIQLQMQTVGELIYATHRGTPSDSDDVQEVLEYVDGLYEELAGHQRQLKLLQGDLLCAACGAENEGGHVYCHNCGQPLSRA